MSLSAIPKLFVPKKDGSCRMCVDCRVVNVITEHFIWPYLLRDVERVIDRFIKCKEAKSRVQPHGLYTPLLVSDMPWININKTDEATHIANLFFKDIVRLHCVQKTIICNRDVKFFSYFWKCCGVS